MDLIKILNEINYNFYITRDLYKEREKNQKTCDFINHVIYNNTYILVLKIVDLLAESKTYSDDIHIDFTKYSEEEQTILHEFYHKYKNYRNKCLAHCTTTELNVQLTLKDLNEIIDILNYHQIGNYTTGADIIFKKLVLEGYE